MDHSLYDFTAAARVKGWSMVAIARRWGVSPRQMSNVAKAPKPRDWDALRGLPEAPK